MLINLKGIINKDGERYVSENPDNRIIFYKTYGGTGDIIVGQPRYTSVEIFGENSSEGTKWKKKSIHEYINIDQVTYRSNHSQIVTIEEVDNAEEIFAEVKAMNLSQYNDNYIEREGRKRYLSTWGVEYNQEKKIVGSAGVTIDEVERIKSLLGVEEKEREMMMTVMNSLEEERDRNVYGLIHNLIDTNLKDMNQESWQIEVTNKTPQKTIK